MFGVVVVVMVAWKRERYGGLGFGFCLGIGFEYWVLFGFESVAVVVVGGVTGLLGSGGGWLRERRRVRETEMEERDVR